MADFRTMTSPGASVPSVIQQQVCKNNMTNENALSYRRKYVRLNDKTKEYAIYEETCPKNETKILRLIREWEKRMGFVTAIRWINAISIILFHLLSLIVPVNHFLRGYSFKWQTFVFGYIMGQVSGFGVTAGVHRYWTHRSYKATLPLQIILIMCYSASGHNNIYNWVRDHRIHHKFSETSADPHNVSRGFFFSHVGWLMMKKHPDVIREGNKIDMSDIANDPLVRFHTKYFNIFKILFCFLLPTLIPVYVWGETWMFSIISQPLLRHMLTLHFTWSVNSFAHIWGNKPYDRHIKPAENWGVSLVAMGEGWHNYHHTFPWDYKASELAYLNNVTTFILNLFAKIGWAYDLKQASPTLIKAVKANRGDIVHLNHE